MQYEEVKENLLKLLGIESDEKGLVEFAFHDAEETALNYCNLTELPLEMKNLILRMTIDIYRNENLGNSDVPEAVSSITEGDISISFGKTADEFRSGFLKDYRIQLNRYRRIRKNAIHRES